MSIEYYLELILLLITIVTASYMCHNRVSSLERSTENLRLDIVHINQDLVLLNRDIVRLGSAQTSLLMSMSSELLAVSSDMREVRYLLQHRLSEEVASQGQR